MLEWEILIEDDLGGSIRFPIDQKSISIGRDAANDICLDERNVSRLHARITIEDDRFFIEDLNSYNGLLLKGQEIAENTQFFKGELIEIGDFHLTLQAEGESTNALSQKNAAQDKTEHWDMTNELSHETRTQIEESMLSSMTPELDSTELNRLKDSDQEISFTQHTTQIEDESQETNLEENFSSSPSNIYDIASQETEIKNIPEEEKINYPRLVAITTVLAGHEYILNQKSMIAGRLRDNDIVIEHRSASRNHAKFYLQNNGDARVIDLKSANGVLVNGVEIDEAILISGDIIELGRVFLRFVPAGEKFQLSETQINKARKDDAEMEDFSPTDQMTSGGLRTKKKKNATIAFGTQTKSSKKWIWFLLFLILILGFGIIGYIWNTPALKSKVENYVKLKTSNIENERAQRQEINVSKQQRNLKKPNPLPAIKKMISQGLFIEAMEKAEQIDEHSEYYDAAMQLWEKARTSGCQRYAYLADEMINTQRFVDAAKMILKIEELNVADPKVLELRQQLKTIDKKGIANQYFQEIESEQIESPKKDSKKRKKRRTRHKKQKKIKSQKKVDRTPKNASQDIATSSINSIKASKKEQAIQLYKKSQSMLAVGKCMMVHALAKEAERIAPKAIPEFQYLRAKCYKQNGESANAIKYFKKYLKIGHQNGKIQESKSAIAKLEN